MKITFTTEHIIPELKGKNAFQVIGELMEHLVSVGTILPETAEPISLAVKQRETSMSTGIGFGIAIPHASTPLTDEIVLAFGRSSNGIDFDSLDKQPVRLVVLMIVPAREKEKHLPTLASISRLLHNREIRVALQHAQDASQILDILNRQRGLTPTLTLV